MKKKETGSEELLKNPAVIEEINKHRWIENEKCGGAMNFESAAEDWLARFSQAWKDYHMPKLQVSEIKSKKEKKRSAKTYID